MPFPFDESAEAERARNVAQYQREERERMTNALAHKADAEELVANSILAELRNWYAKGLSEAYFSEHGRTWLEAERRWPGVKSVVEWHRVERLVIEALDPYEVVKVPVYGYKVDFSRLRIKQPELRRGWRRLFGA